MVDFNLLHISQKSDRIIICVLFFVESIKEAKKIQTNISESELLILEFLWSKETPQSFSDIMFYFSTQGNKTWKKQTVNTFLIRLSQKGYLKADKSSRKTYYIPIFSKEEYYCQYAHKILDTFFHGSLIDFMSVFAGSQKLSASEKKELIDFIETL